MTPAAREPQAQEEDPIHYARPPAQLTMPLAVPIAANVNDAGATNRDVQCGRWRPCEIDGLKVLSDMPELLPVLHEEHDLVRIYFADLIENMLKVPS